MEQTIAWLFWLSAAIVFYSYLGYGLVLFVMVRLKRRKTNRSVSPTLPDPAPKVTLIVCAFNEQDWIEEKIANSLQLDYPRSRIHFWYVTDGSNDATAELVKNYPYPEGTHWRLLHQPERRGKIAAFQRAMHEVTTPLVISTDANTFVNPEGAARLLRHFSDPQVGAVAGEKRISMSEKDDASSAGEGIYWKYESALKRMDAELWSVVGAAGELFAFRTELYEPVPPDTIVEDFYMTMRIAQRGYRVQYEPGAYAVEKSSASVGEELKRKVRIAAGGWQAVWRLAPLLNVFRYGLLSFQYISHRVLRWVLSPFLLPLIFIFNLLLALEGSAFYQGILVLQVLFYGAALAGYGLEQRKMKIKAFFVPYYFCVMNYAQYAGLRRFLRGQQSVLWERAARR